MNNRGFTLVELLIAAAIVTAAMIPLVALYSQQNMQAHFTEQHMMARYRAQRLADEYDSLEYATIKALAEQTKELGAYPKGISPEAKLLPSPLKPLEQELKELSGLTDLPEDLVHCRDKMSLQQEAVYFHELEPGLGRLEIAIAWRLPTDKQRKTRIFNYYRLITKMDVSSFARHEIVQN